MNVGCVWQEMHKGRQEFRMLFATLKETLTSPSCYLKLLATVGIVRWIGPELQQEFY
jgi:hypothetical protein